MYLSGRAHALACMSPWEAQGEKKKKHLVASLCQRCLVITCLALTQIISGTTFKEFCKQEIYQHKDSGGAHLLFMFDWPHCEPDLLLTVSKLDTGATTQVPQFTLGKKPEADSSGHPVFIQVLQWEGRSNIGFMCFIEKKLAVYIVLK